MNATPDNAPPTFDVALFCRTLRDDLREGMTQGEVVRIAKRAAAGFPDRSITLTSQTAVSNFLNNPDATLDYLECNALHASMSEPGQRARFWGGKDATVIVPPKKVLGSVDKHALAYIDAAMAILREHQEGASLERLEKLLDRSRKQSALLQVAMINNVGN